MIVRSLLRRAEVFALATAGLGFAAPALASDAANSAARGVGSAQEEVFAGYNYFNTGYLQPHFVSATTTFKVPKLRCGSADQAIAPSIGSYDEHGRPSVAALFVGCYGGKAHYWPELTVNGSVRNYPTMAAHAGDTIVLLLDTKNGHASVADETRKFKVSRTGRGGSGVDQALIGEEGWASSRDRPERVERVPDFGTLTYSNTKVFGRPLGRPFGLGQYSRSNRSAAGTLQIKTGPLFSGGKAFRTYFKHS